MVGVNRNYFQRLDGLRPKLTMSYNGRRIVLSNLGAPEVVVDLEEGQTMTCWRRNRYDAWRKKRRRGSDDDEGEKKRKDEKRRRRNGMKWGASRCDVEMLLR